MKKKGSALINVTIIMTLAFLLVAISVDRSLKSYRRIQENLDDIRAYYLAESLVYDLAGYVNESIDWPVLGDSGVLKMDAGASSTSNPDDIPVITDSRVESYKVRLVSDIVKTYEDNSTIELAYNMEANVVYAGRNYTVIMQLGTRYEKGPPIIYSSHYIRQRKAFRW